MKVLKITFEDSFVGGDYFYAPIEDNVNNVFYINGGTVSPETTEELIEVLEAYEWSYTGLTPKIEVVDEELEIDYSNITTCAEFDIYIFVELAIEGDLYDTPYDNSPDSQEFSCNIALSAYRGELYSKDFAYYSCDSCNRYICYQNPRNGWHVQFKAHDGWMECDRCYQERILTEGHDIETMIETQQIEGSFFDSSELEENGWKLEKDNILVGSGRVGYSDPENFFNMLEDYRHKDTLISYDDIAIGGLGGYVSIYTKN